MPKYIDADALKKAFLIEGKDVCDATDEFDTMWGASQELIEKVIDSATAADVEPVKHGRWVKMTGMMPPEFTGHYECSECEWFCKKHSIKETDFDFCPGCGADMRRRNEDAD